MLTVIFALAAAWCAASEAVLARLASVAAPEGQSSGWRYGLYLLRQPIWLVGQVFAIGVFVMTGVALYFGEVAVVQPLLVVQLIFVLWLRQFRLHDDIPRRSWYAGALICIGLAAFLPIANVHGGTREPATSEWIVALSVWTAATALLWLAGQRGSPSRRAACLGASAALVWSVDASFVKKTTDTLQLHGFPGMFAHWPVYGLVVTGILGTVLTQAAFNAGPLSASQPAMLIVDPLASIILGVQIFGEHISHTAPAVLGSTLSLIIMCVGVVLMSRWAPPSIEPIPGDPIAIMRYGRRAVANQ